MAGCLRSCPARSDAAKDTPEFLERAKGARVRLAHRSVGSCPLAAVMPRFPGAPSRRSGRRLNYSLGQRISIGESGFFLRRHFFPDIVGGATLKPARKTILS